MQWFLALAESSPAFQQYGEMIKIAVHTAQQHTSLRPHLLYDGEENALTNWLRQRDVKMIPCRTFLREEIATLACGVQEAGIRAALRGILLRIELPRLAENLGLDERVLYTDCDVFFQAEIAPDLAAIDCEYFAVAPEFDRADYRNMNTGVMWMNLRRLREVDAEFRAFVRQNLFRLQSIAWDQGAYREFFAAADGGFRWNKLAPEFNWKPYWGDFHGARIVHFHGPKPFQRLYIDSHFSELKNLTGGSFEEACDLWQQLLLEAT